MLDIIPIGYRIIVKQDKVPEKVGNIFIPPTNKELESTEGLVLARGEGVMDVDVGEVVYYGKYAGFKFTRGDAEYVFLNEEDILGKVIKQSSSPEFKIDYITSQEEGV